MRNFRNLELGWPASIARLPARAADCALASPGKVGARARDQWRWNARLFATLCLTSTVTLLLPACSSTSATPDFVTAWAEDPAMSVPLDPQALDHALIARAILEATNDVRRQLGLKPFIGLPALEQAADLQASANALSVTARHFNIVNAWATPTDRVRSFGLMGAVSENVALLSLYDFDVTHGYTERAQNSTRVIFDGSTGQIAPRHSYASFARAIVLAWMNSPGHRANIMNPGFVNLGCSARTSRSVSGLDMMAGVQVFFTPYNSAVRR